MPAHAVRQAVEPRPRRPHRAVLAASALALCIWLVFLALIAWRAA